MDLKKSQLDSFLLKNKDVLSSSQLADYYHDSGNKLYFQSWRKTRNKSYLDSAIVFTKRAAILKLEKDFSDKISLAKSLYNLGYFNYQKKDYFEAVEAYLMLLKYAPKTEKSKFAYKELGLLYQIIGDYQKSIENYYRFIGELHFHKENGVSRSLAVTHLRLSDTYFNMGHDEYKNEIESHLNKAENYLESMVKTIPVLNFRLHLIRGNLLLYSNNYQGAIDEYQLAASYAKNFNEHHLAVLSNSLGLAHLNILDLNDAENYLFKSIRLDKNYSLPYENLGDVYMTKNEFKKGLLHYQKAIALSTFADLNSNYDDLVTSEDLQLSVEKTYLLSHLVAKANAWLEFFKYDGNKDHLNHALASFERADQLIDIIRSQSTEHQSKLYWRKQSGELYMKAVEACFLLDNPQRAYYFMERNKALLLLEDVTHEKAKELSKLPDSIAKLEFELRRSIHLAENNLKNNAKASPDSLSAIKKSVFDQKRVYEMFMDSITLSFPDYARLKRQLRVLSLEDCKSKYATQKQAILQYILNDEQGYGLLNTESETLLFELGEVETLIANIEELHLLLSKVEMDAKKGKKFRKTAHEIFKTLIPQNIYGHIDEKQLIIVPDFKLQTIPFEVLVTNGASEEYLIAKNEIRYAYSLSYLDAKSEQDKLSGEGLLAVAPIEFKALGLANLGFSRLEVNEVQQILGGESLVHDMATKSAVLKSFEDYQIIHLSTHADIDENGNHWVAFSDEYLYLNEIYANKNQAEMVVLSACNTSRGELMTGEGVMSLARAFFNSGAKSVVSSLWQVPDKSGKDIMVEFYRGLDRGMTKSAAMREAKLNYMQQNQKASLNPSLWAALIVIGDNSPIKNTNFIIDNWVWILLVMVLMFSAVKAIRRYTSA